MLFARIHRGYLGLWCTSVAVALCTLVTSVVFLIGGAATASPTLRSGENLLPIRGWGALFALVALAVLATHMVPRTSLYLRGLVMVVMAMPWVLWTGVFAGYASGHGGAGTLGAVIWGTIAVVIFSSALTATGYARNPRPR